MRPNLRILGNGESEPGLERWHAVAPGTEPPRRPETWKAGRVMILSALSGAVVGFGVAWAVFG